MLVICGECLPHDLLNPQIVPDRREWPPQPDYHTNGFCIRPLAGGEARVPLAWLTFARACCAHSLLTKAMNTLVSVAVDSVPCVAVAPSAQGATCPSKSARHQAALLALGRMQLSGLNSVEIAQEFVPVIARALGTSICGLIEVVPDAAPSAIEQIICEPESALRSGPRPGATTDDDGFLAILLEKSVRLLVADVQTDGRFHKTWCHRQ
jgi:hypothetical protein